MLILYTELKNYPLIYAQSNEQDRRNVEDILMNSRENTIAYFVYKDVQSDADHTQMKMAANTIDMVNAMGSGSQGNVANMPTSDVPIYGAGQSHQLYFINAGDSKVESQKIYYRGQVKNED
ncbi:hypothetical protein JOD45_002720 [Scopulibacillus daqui]|uniref:Uncharacterized protein n=1 Tax=Scopulibacillus daqui TaxID=1469162 RepID=A0ABS2Q2H6_9BACL|nr:hypothetical protein [Scopulibacillus daqui]MBM7646490.1 hypothetical protein [Scopulibacillus daqui]